jgi:uncharacterized protein (DUF433 family)
MVQAMAIKEMRQMRVPLPRIRDAADWMRKYHPEIHFPFAYRHRTFIAEHSKQIIVALPGEQLDKYVEISGANKGQLVERALLGDYLKRLRFNKDERAVKYVPVSRHGVSIELDPEIRFGQPRVMPSGFLVATLSDAAAAEGSLRNAARLYNVSPAEVELAVDYLTNLRAMAA